MEEQVMKKKAELLSALAGKVAFEDELIRRQGAVSPLLLAVADELKGVAGIAEKVKGRTFTKEEASRVQDLILCRVVDALQGAAILSFSRNTAIRSESDAEGAEERGLEALEEVVTDALDRCRSVGQRPPKRDPLFEETSLKKVVYAFPVLELLEHITVALIRQVGYRYNRLLDCEEFEGEVGVVGEAGQVSPVTTTVTRLELAEDIGTGERIYTAVIMSDPESTDPGDMIGSLTLEGELVWRCKGTHDDVSKTLRDIAGKHSRSELGEEDEEPYLPGMEPEPSTTEGVGERCKTASPSGEEPPPLAKTIVSVEEVAEEEDVVLLRGVALIREDGELEDVPVLVVDKGMLVRVVAPLLGQKNEGA